ncbi:MAG TPA: thioesterase family protein [Acidimicrobiales bacterium]
MPTVPSHPFDAAIAVRSSGEPSLFRTDVDPGWAVGDKPNGGYLQALLGQAARMAGRDESHPDWEVQSVAVTYLRPPAFGPADVRTELLRRGRSAAHVRAVLVQGDQDLVDAVFVLAGLPESPAPRYDATPALMLPPPDECVRLPPQIPGGARVGVVEVTELRLDPATIPFRESPAPEDAVAEIRGWTRFDDGREPDALSLLFSVDAIPPATFMIGSSGWVPTLQMSTYIRARPAPGWLRIRMTANVVADGVVDETCVVWDALDHVVAQSTQLARLRFPDETV